MLKKIFLSTLLCTTLSTPVIGKVNAEEVKHDKPVKYVFKSGGKASPIYINSDGSMTIPEETELEVVAPKPNDYYVYKDGVETKEVNPKYNHIKNQREYMNFYISKGRTADLFVGEHPRPLDGVTFIPKSDKTSDDNNVNNPKDEPKSDQTEPNQNNTDNKSKSDQPKQDVPAKVEQPAKVDKKDTTDQNKSDTNKDNKAVANNKSNDQNKVAVNNQKSEPQSSDVYKKVDVKKEDNNKDVKTKDTSSKAKA
ncbi:hypothetical protein Q1L93_05155, partial [Mammaliicoccus sciuri]